MITETRIKEMLEDPRYKTRMALPVRVIFTDNIPYKSARSIKPNVYYISKSMRRYFVLKGQRIDIAQLLILLEKSTKALIDIFHLTQREAVVITVEHVYSKAIKFLGLDSRQMDVIFDFRLRGMDKRKDPPKDLDPTQYSISDQKILKRKLKEQNDRIIRKGSMSKLRPDETTSRLERRRVQSNSRRKGHNPRGRP